MEASEVRNWNTLIEDHISKLETEIEELKADIKPISPDRAIGRLSRLEAMNDKSVREANLAKAERRLVQLKAAKNRLAQGEFGLCAECEEPISKKRLELLPETTVCMDCIKERGN